jgi:serum/glucocorticoid-regulated kinase 2
MVKFSDFEVIELIGEGSFGKVFRVIKKDTGQAFAMKSMKKSLLIQQNQIRYAVTEAQIMKQLDHPYVLKLLYCF